MSNTPRALGGFPILALHPKSLRQIGNLWLSERTPEVLTNLSWEVRFFVGNVEGIEALAKPIFARGAALSMAGGPAAPFNGSGTAARPRSSSKSIAPNRESLVFGTNSGSADEPLMRGSFFCGERGGDRSIGEANLRKGAALQWLAHLAPVRGAAPIGLLGLRIEDVAVAKWKLL